MSEGTKNVAEIVIEQTEAGSGQFYEFEPGMYDAVVADIEETDNPFEEDKSQLQFTFEVPEFQNEDGSTASKRGWANPVWNSKSKLWGWAAAILGTEPAEGEPFRTSSLIGKPCRIVLNTGKKLDGTKVIKLTDVLGPTKAAPKKAGLVERLQEEACSFPKCKTGLETYDAEGNPWCNKHKPADDDE